MTNHLKILSAIPEIKKSCVVANRQSPGVYYPVGWLFRGNASCCLKFLYLIHLAVGLSHDLNWKGGCFYRRLALIIPMVT